jgi:maleamate amidohydrolase
MKTRVEETESGAGKIGLGTALVIIDVQRDFSEPNGKAPVCREQADNMIPVINGLVERFAAQNIDVIYIVHEWTNPIIRFLTRNAAAKGTVGAEIDNRIKVVGSLKFCKSSASSFTNKEFEQYLKSKGLTHLCVTGLAAEHCVKATIRDGLKKGYVITAVRDGIAAKKCKNLEKNLKKYKEQGVEVILSSDLAERLGG